MAAHTTRILGGARWKAAAASPAVLGLLAVLLAASGIWMYRQARDVRADPAARNTALTDSAATSEVKGAAADMIGRLFSYTYTDPGRTDAAARTCLTGAAVRQYAALMGRVRADAPRQRTVLSTKVTDSAVITLRDGRARLLVYADQQTTRVADGKSTTSPAMLAVTAVRHSRQWRITSIDTFQNR
jgi:Mce-associated membrane protein